MKNDSKNTKQNKVLREYINRFVPAQSRVNILKQAEINNTLTKLDIDVESFYTHFTPDSAIPSLPFLYEIDIFCLRLLIAKLKKEKICIYADFDTDAVTATGVMYHGLIDLGFEPELIKFYTPDRFREGYGINSTALIKLGKIYDLIITVDCGISSIYEADLLANTSECELIITDHHLMAESVRPNALSVCNPVLTSYYQSSGNKYPNMELRLKLISRIGDLDISYIDKISTWITNYDKTLTEKLDLSTISDQFLSKSVTGVGVAWFCLVWMGYFLEFVA